MSTMKTELAFAICTTFAVALPAVAQFNSVNTRGFSQTQTPGVVRTFPGAAPGVGVPGMTVPATPRYGYGYNPYQTTTGFYNPNVGNINYPAFGTPINTGGSYYNVPSGNSRLPMWKAPSGYYYPWCPRPTGFVYAYPMPVLVVENQTQPAPALPPLSTIMSDMEKFLEDSKKDGKITERDYTNMLRRVKDLKSKERTMRIAAGGTLDPGDESQLRTDLDQVGSELTWRLNR